MLEGDDLVLGMIKDGGEEIMEGKSWPGNKEVLTPGKRRKMLAGRVSVMAC